MSNKLDRTIQFVSMSLRDYYSTFATYMTAINVLLVGAVVLQTSTKGDPVNDLAVAVSVSVAGLWVCLQWHISTSSMRLTYRYYLIQIEELRKNGAHCDLPPLFKKSWLKFSKFPLGAGPINVPILGLRGASLPIVYGAIFFFILLHRWEVIDSERGRVAVVAVGVVVLLSLIARERSKEVRKLLQEISGSAEPQKVNGK